MSELLKLANQLTDRATKHQDAAEAIPDTAGVIALGERDKHIAQARVCLDIARMAVNLVTVPKKDPPIKIPSINGHAMPERIWLSDFGHDNISWCEDPNPLGLPDDEIEAVEYQRVDTL